MMIELTITPRHSKESVYAKRWFVEWPNNGPVSPSKLFRLLEIIYTDMKYHDMVGFCIALVGFDPKGQKDEIIKTHPTHEVLWMDELMGAHYPEYVNQLSEQLQSRYEIEGVVFTSEFAAEQFKEKIMTRYTFHLLQKEHA